MNKGTKTKTFAGSRLSDAQRKQMVQYITKTGPQSEFSFEQGPLTEILKPQKQSSKPARTRKKS